MSDNQPEVQELDVPEVRELTPAMQCVWCGAQAAFVIDGNSCCRRHKQTAWVWASAKRANRTPHPATYPRRTPEGNPR